jgi:hypothetical protein
MSTDKNVIGISPTVHSFTRWRITTRKKAAEPSPLSFGCSNTEAFGFYCNYCYLFFAAAAAAMDEFRPPAPSVSKTPK